MTWVQHILIASEIIFELGICIKLKLPSCMCAHPKKHIRIRGRNSLVAYSIKRVIFSPIMDLILPH